MRLKCGLVLLLIAADHTAAGTELGVTDSDVFRQELDAKLIELSQWLRYVTRCSELELIACNTLFCRVQDYLTCFL